VGEGTDDAGPVASICDLHRLPCGSIQCEQRLNEQIGDADMKQTTDSQKATHPAAQMSDQGIGAGAQGVALAPPAYGIDVVDHALGEAGPEHGQTPAPAGSIQLKAAAPATGDDAGTRRANRTGLPDNLKAGIERLSGLAMDDVRVHYNSAKPAQLQALAYTQGAHIYLGARQERHLPHEAWHVVQQKQGRVQSTMLLRDSIPINDDRRLEREADAMGAKALVNTAQIQDKSSVSYRQLSNDGSQVGDHNEMYVDAVADQIVRKSATETLLDMVARPAPTSLQIIQRMYVYDDAPSGSGNFWTNYLGLSYTIDENYSEADNGMGIKLTFNEVTTNLPSTFTIPAFLNGRKFHSVEKDGVWYGNRNSDNTSTSPEDRIKYTDLRFIAMQNAQSALPRIDDANYAPNYHNTSFLARVSLIPLSSLPGGLYTSSDLWVKQVKVSNDRPPTKFGKNEGQRSHTVAWSLLRAAPQGLGGQSLGDFIAMLDEMFKEFKLPDDPASSQAPKALHDTVTVGIGILKNKDRIDGFTFWQRGASELLSKFVHAYQLSEEATYRDGRATGHDESRHLATLREAEVIMKLGRPLDAKKLAQVQKAAVGMLDYKENLTLNVRWLIFRHWINDLFLAFPNLMAKHSEDIWKGLELKPEDEQAFTNLFSKDSKKDSKVPLDKIKTKLTTRVVSSPSEPKTMALPTEHQSTFVANLVLVPSHPVEQIAVDFNITDKGNSVSPYQLNLEKYISDQLQIKQLNVADDRPNTRFGRLQRSHTVAWTLVRRHLMHFRGKTATTLANFILNELAILKNDIDTPSTNSKIQFDAPMEAAKKRVNLAAVVQAKKAFPLYQWQTLLSELVETYVTLYQLSRSATYSVEERPQPHGEHNAIVALANMEKQEVEYDKETAVTKALKLVDANVATSMLPPENWQIAIEHWLKLLEELYPNLCKNQDFKEALKERISVMDPKEELLAGYENKGLSEQEKVLINLYENAKQEIRNIPEVFVKDLKTSIRLELSNLVPQEEIKPSDSVSQEEKTWPFIIDKLEPPEKMTRTWAAIFTTNFNLLKTKRGNIQSVPTQENFATLLKVTEPYFKKVETSRDEIIRAVTGELYRMAEGEKKAFVESNMKQISSALEAGVNEAINLSGVSTLNNYVEWFKLLKSFNKDETITYSTLNTAISSKRKRED
jgi:hypothetical protein